MGLHPPDKWPTYRTIKDFVLVTVPKDISPGVYSLSVKMFMGTQYPNYTLADILMDADVYQGVIVGSITAQ